MTKTILLLITLLFSFGFTPKEKDPCRKVFKKEHKKKKKSTAFSQTRSFETKGTWIDQSYARKIYLAFSYTDSSMFLDIGTVLTGAISLKREFSFDKSTVIAFILENNEILKVNVQEVQNRNKEIGKSKYSNLKVEISESFIKSLTSSEIRKIEILNPYRITRNSDNVYSKELNNKSKEKLKNDVSCFYNRIEGVN